ncbi:unnamed protein product [Ostreobium quekettii]|uniref:Peptidase S1 domain-containing protein n=1 Tax=Ostreobium quekettii TaxID=121088 RepID=A0A8S1JCH6_9CHLO|nr:unnamed protein product [Ostreobium quekettii]|eukprot:evm.model.scf_2751EXC.1 EVM.evm.TU.scf_2751EXC.1   scf_2751EXC:2219-3400(+)
MSGFPALPRGLFIAALIQLALAAANSPETRAAQALSWHGRRALQTDEVRPQAKIFGGVTTEPGEFPFFASLRHFGNHFCGGVLVSPNLVLTAAHCVDGNRAVPRHPAVQVGLHGVNDGPVDSPYFEEFRVCRTIVHSQFDVRDLLNGYDIALLVLDRPSTAGQLALLPSGVELEPGDPTVVTGFGKVGNHRVATTLQKTEIMRVISNEECTDKWQAASPGVEIKNTLLCVFAGNGTDVCQGDSGGPVLDEDASVVLGVVSFGPPDCALTDVPGVFTRITEYLGWVEALGGADSVAYDSDECSAEPMLPKGAVTEQSAAEEIIDAIEDGNTDLAVELIQTAVESGNVDTVVEAMEMAVESGLQKEAGEALFAAVRAGVSIIDLQPAFRALRGRK